MLIQPFQTDFSRFFNRAGPLPIPNNISLIVDEHVIECNGPILAQHSRVMFDKLTKGNEVFLDEFSGMFEGVLDCIEILYGQSVEVCLDNLQALMKFSVLYKVKEIYEVCMTWVHKHASLEKFSEFFEIGNFINNLEDNHPDTLEVCRDLVVNCDEPKTFVEILTTNLKSNENDKTDLMMFFLEDGLMDYTLPIVTDWIDSDKKAVTVLERVENRQLFDSLAEQNVTLQGLEFIEKLCEVSDTIQTANKAASLQSKLARSNHALFEAISTLNKKPWTTLTEQPLLDSLSSLAARLYPVYIEVCINATLNRDETVKALWPTINPLLVGKSFYNDVVKELHATGLQSHYFQYQVETEIDGYNIPLTRADCEALVALKPITLLFGCQVKGCVQTSKHAVTVQLSAYSEETPCYNLKVKQKRHPTVASHVHNRSICHWYITHTACSWQIQYSSQKQNRRWTLVSLATNTRKEVIDALNIVFTPYTAPPVIFNIGCILNDLND